MTVVCLYLLPLYSICTNRSYYLLYFIFINCDNAHLPETAGTTPAELQAELVKKNQGCSYHNMDIEGMSAVVPPSQDEWDDAMRQLAEESNDYGHYENLSAKPLSA